MRVLALAGLLVTLAFMHGVDVGDRAPALPHVADRPLGTTSQTHALDAHGQDDSQGAPSRAHHQQGHGTEHTSWATTCLAVLCAAAVAVAPFLARRGSPRWTRGRAPQTRMSWAPRLSPPREAVSIHQLCVMRV
ncbi:hypothetical protein BJF86_04695 [Serinicoccus sp. CNJ-927]|nr:hypothetical protein BJF86_04695 [Serinicoccus sp. CNJ-927]